MSDKTEELVSKPQPLNMTGGWDAQVNGRADKAEESRQKRLNWEEQQKELVKARKRANRILYGILFGLTMIVAGGCCLNYVEGVPIWAALSMSILGVAAYMFTLGWIIGHKARR